MAGHPRTLAPSLGAGRSEGEAREPERGGGGLPDCSPFLLSFPPSPTLARGPVMSSWPFQAPSSRGPLAKDWIHFVVSFTVSCDGRVAACKTVPTSLFLSCVALQQLALSPRPRTLTSGPQRGAHGTCISYLTPNRASHGLMLRRGWPMPSGSSRVRREGGEDGRVRIGRRAGSVGLGLASYSGLQGTDGRKVGPRGLRSFPPRHSGFVGTLAICISALWPGGLAERSSPTPPPCRLPWSTLPSVVSPGAPMARWDPGGRVH